MGFPLSGSNITKSVATDAVLDVFIYFSVDAYSGSTTLSLKYFFWPKVLVPEIIKKKQGNINKLLWISTGYL
jgi:hypothetical protein